MDYFSIPVKPSGGPPRQIFLPEIKWAKVRVTGKNVDEDGHTTYTCILESHGTGFVLLQTRNAVGLSRAARGRANGSLIKPRLRHRDTKRFYLAGPQCGAAPM